MKLNDKGFGMKEMIIIMSGLLLFLLLAAYNVSKLYSSIEKSQNEAREAQKVVEQKKEEEVEVPVIVEKVNEEYYKNLELKFKNATLDYMNDYRYDMSSQIMSVTSDTLEGLNYISMVDQFGNKTCDGYSNVFYDEVNEEYVIKSFIRCTNYISEGY